MAKEEKTQQAVRENAASPIPSGEELVDYTAPVMPWLNDQDIFVAVNAETIRIKRGVGVKIKRKFLEVLEHAQAQEMAAYAYMNAAKKAGENAIAKM